jgi:hypothetical protein
MKMLSRRTRGTMLPSAKVSRLLSLGVACALALGAAACDDGPAKGAAGAATQTTSTTTTSTTTTAAPSGTKVGDLPLAVDLPAGAVANEGAPGFHSADDTWSILVKAAGDGDPKDLAGAKEAAQMMLFKKWVKSDKTADGWVLSWVGTGMAMDGKEYDNHPFTVRRKIGGANYDCYGSVKQAADVDKNIKLCQAIKAAP